MNNYKTEQENFWAGDFGKEYITRNQDHTVNIPLFSKILEKTRDVNTMIEFGSNIGLNLRAVNALKPNLELSAVEINEEATKELEKLGYIKNIYHKSILEFETDYKRDLVLIKGVLIHINPNELDTVYEHLYNTSNKYICISEYYNPTPIEIDYRGHKERLFKRDFAGEMLDKYKDLKLVDYGFSYHRDNNFPLDDTTWFLLEKQN